MEEKLNGLLTVTVGLPGSGKTTWANKAFDGELDFGFVRAGRDHLRRALFDSVWLGQEQEFFLTKIQESIIRAGLREGKIVLVDDMNLRAQYRKRLRRIADEEGSGYFQVDFTQVSLETCLERNKSRENQVPEKVIRDLHKRFIEPLKGKVMPWPESQALTPPHVGIEKVSPDWSLPSALIVDLDGTLAKIPEGGRNVYDWTRVSEDEVNYPVLYSIEAALASGWAETIIFMSGRVDKCYFDTLDWIEDNTDLEVNHLYMRADGDRRDDAIVKLELFNKHVRGKFNVRAVYDDRNRVVKMWRKLGLTCFQVADGDF